MVKTYVEDLEKKENPREALSRLRSLIKEEEQRTELMQLIGNGDVLFLYLAHEDAKTRKNAALLIGDLKLQEALPMLKDAYERETTLFVKSSYLTAMSKLDVTELLDFFKEQRECLLASEPAEEDRKHVSAYHRNRRKKETHCLRIEKAT